VVVPESLKREKRTEDRSRRRGLVLVFTGDGKGKTTSALGHAVRAAAYGWRVLFLQFVKGTWFYGEMETLERLAPEVDHRVVGKGFVGILDDDLPREEHARAAREGLAFAKEHLSDYDLVVLDEVNVAVQTGLLAPEDLLDVIRAKPGDVHLILTGRGAPPEVIEAADLVTEMRPVKHPFDAGITAQLGIEY
jgi:cob(I)alamin adenosyltransferase